jgi:hypothetical protein
VRQYVGDLNRPSRLPQQLRRRLPTCRSNGRAWDEDVVGSHMGNSSEERSKLKRCPSGHRRQKLTRRVVRPTFDAMACREFGNKVRRRDLRHFGHSGQKTIGRDAKRPGPAKCCGCTCLTLPARSWRVSFFQEQIGLKPTSTAVQRCDCPPPPAKITPSRIGRTSAVGLRSLHFTFASRRPDALGLAHHFASNPTRTALTT